jgi:hypothetical protein
MSEMVSAPVAISSSAIPRRLDNLCSVLGGAKPGLPVRSTMGVILRISLNHTIAAEAGAGSAGFGRRH